MARVFLAFAILAMAAALAGCTNSDSSTATSSSSSSSGSLVTPPSSYNITATGGGNGTGANATAAQWTYDNRSGTVSGNALIVSNPPPKDETFTVHNGTAELTVNASADGNGVHVSLRPPGCTSSDCEVKVGDASPSQGTNKTLMQPKDGDWAVHLVVMGGPGPVSSKYDLLLGQETMVASAGISASMTSSTGGGNATSSSTTTTSGSL